MTCASVDIGAFVLLTLIAGYVLWRRGYLGVVTSEHFLIYPYTDLANDGYRGNPYALSECSGATD